MENSSLLPDDVKRLQAIIAAQTEELERQSENLRSRDALIKKLNAEITALKRIASGPWW
ncbi:hypothetical protein [Ensifer adhaerens]|uniref:hypothetical protein n=1 Tax=Ensifer adhaerens TaxID=106592 RepID=UPI0015EBA8B4|nr:hypothetical protein [Ensifer adhaerens]